MTLTVGAFATSIDEAWAILSEAKIAVSRNYYPDHAAVKPSTARATGSYRDEFDLYVNSLAYNFKLEDGSVLAFRRTPNDKTEHALVYLHCPYDVLSYEDFLAKQLGVSTETDDGVGTELYEDYLRNGTGLRAHVTPVRYDWSPQLYHAGLHPAGHCHLGVENEIRLAVDWQMSPSMFSLLIARQFYPLRWAKKLLVDERVVTITRRMRAEPVSAEYVSAKDQLELRLK